MKILYTKFSNQRRNEYKISTSIIQDGEKKYIVKKALYPIGEEHIKNMQNRYNDLKTISDDIGWSVVQGEKCQDGGVIFPFVKGEAFEEIIERLVDKSDYDEAIGLIMDFNSKVLGSSLIHKFEYNEEFRKIFGDIVFDEYSLHSFDVSNIDMIYSNFLVDASRYILIDYEWVFDFQIPVEFVLYRSLFHNASFQKIPSEYQDKVYSQLHINDNLKNIFLKMEFSFQDYVKGETNDLDSICKRIGNKAKSMEEMEYGLNSGALKVGGNIVLKERTFQTEIEFQKSIKGMSGDIELQLNNCNGIYKMKFGIGIKQGKETPLKIQNSNCELKIIDDYYFSSSEPKIIFENEDYDEVKIGYCVVEKDNVLMENIISSLIETNKYKLESQKYEKAYREYKSESEEYKKAYEECGKLLEDCQKAYNIKSKELDEIQSEFWWKIKNKFKKK